MYKVCATSGSVRQIRTVFDHYFICSFSLKYLFYNQGSLIVRNHMIEISHCLNLKLLLKSGSSSSAVKPELHPVLLFFKTDKEKKMELFKGKYVMERIKWKY